MKRKILLFGTLLWSLHSITGQICGTPQPTNPTAYPQLGATTQLRGSSSAFCIDVFFHIVRNTDGTNAFPLPNVDAIVVELNVVYSPYNILVNNAGMDFIDNDDFLIIDTDVGEDNELFGRQNQQEFINFYIVDGFTNIDLIGKAENIPSRNLVMRDNEVLTNVSAHELGHCLNLYHTHQPGGDMVNDTPNDPGLGPHNVNSNCEYTGEGGFSPLANNIMSYSRIICLSDFTEGQGQRMRQAIESESILQNITSNLCTTISEVNTICDSQTTTVMLSNLGTATTTWTSSENVQIVSSSHSSAQIRPINASSTGSGWVRATLDDGIVFEEHFDIKNAPTASSISLDSFRSVNLYSDRWTNITATYNHVIDIGQLGYDWHWYASPAQMRDDGISYIHVKPTNNANRVWIRVQAENECGCSDWVGKWFDVVQVSSNCRDCPTDGDEIHY